MYMRTAFIGHNTGAIWVIIIHQEFDWAPIAMPGQQGSVLK